jgi:hypothetical protein
MINSTKQHPSLKVAAPNPCVRGLILDGLELAQKTIGQAAVPLYRTDARKVLVHLGSGVLLFFEGRRLLVTAAHVIDHEVSSAMYLPSAGKKLVSLEGAGFKTTSPEGNRLKDKYDFAVLKLDESKLNELGAVSFLDENTWKRESTTEYGHYYCALGYPTSKNKKINHLKKHVRTTRLAVASRSVKESSLCKKMAVSGKEHIFLRYEQLSMDDGGQINNSVLPVGMSGGALVDPGKLGETKRAPRLAGILIEYHGSHKAMVATRIEVIIDTLKRALMDPKNPYGL